MYASMTDDTPAPQSDFVSDQSSHGAVKELINSSIILLEDWNNLHSFEQEEILHCRHRAEMLQRLVELGLLTEYQRARVQSGTTFGLVLGNYRILDRLGAGGMGVVFRGEHIDLRRQVAIKVLPVSSDQDTRLLQRFICEMRTVAQLNHPNIVAAMDAGKVVSNDPDTPLLRFFVMEFVPGQDLEEMILAQGPLPYAKACDVIYQVACALLETSKYHFVHRDIKPSNILVTPEGQAKLLDFGLARHLESRATTPGVPLGTWDYVAPEQGRDASSVDIRADIYGLGGTLYWCLTGKVPFPGMGDSPGTLSQRLLLPPPSVLALNPDVPADLDGVIAKMMAVDPAERHATPQELMNALLPFLRPEMREQVMPASVRISPDLVVSKAKRSSDVLGSPRALIVDDESSIRSYCAQILQADGVLCDEAANGQQALDMIAAQPYDLALIDVDMPIMKGDEVLRRLRANPPYSNLKIIMFSGRSTSDDLARSLIAGADDYLTKPFSVIQLQGRAKAALRLKAAQDRTEVLNRRILTMNAELEKNLTARDSDLVGVRNALVLALAKLVAHRDTETGAHLLRLQRYCRCLAEKALAVPAFVGQIDRNFIEMLECCAPLHDIGKVGLPDHILLKPGKFSPEERILMQAHTIIGADTLKAVLQQYGSAVAFLQMAIEVARHHHERYDGAGYPDRLAGNDIPLSARILAIADVYDALRSRRVYKPALSHPTAVHLILEGSPGQFDPLLLQVFQRCTNQFDRIFTEFGD
jgi:response regulator RpfG family c-di-GMP phosphodiesterase